MDERVWARTRTHTHAHMNRETVQDVWNQAKTLYLSLFILLFFLPNHSPTLSGQIAAAFDVLRSTFAGASALFYDSNSFCFYGHLFQHSVQSFYWHFKAHPPVPIFQALFLYGSYKNF